LGNCCSPLTTAQVGVVPGEPVGANRREYVEIDSVFERYGPVRNVGRDGQHLTLAHDDFLAFDLELQRAFEDVGDLLAVMMMFGHHRILLQKYLRDHGLVAGDDLARDHVAHDFERYRFPTDVFHGNLLSHHNLVC
jgi:hypothetical protein